MLCQWRTLLTSVSRHSAFQLPKRVSVLFRCTTDGAHHDYKCIIIFNDVFKNENRLLLSACNKLLVHLGQFWHDRDLNLEFSCLTITEPILRAVIYVPG